MNEVFISTFRKIIEQNLAIYKNSQSDLRDKGRKSLEYIISMTQKQLIVLKPTVVLTRFEQTQTGGPDSSIQSTPSKFIGFPDYDNSKTCEVEVGLCNQESMTSNVKEIRNLIETEVNKIPFIDVHSQTVDKLILMTKEKEEEKKQILNSQNRKGRKKKKLVSTEEEKPQNTPLLRSAPMTLQSSEEVLNGNLSPLDNLESEIFPQPKTIGNKDVDGEEKRTIKTSLRTRKPVMSASYYDAVEPLPKKKKKSKQDFSSTSTFENAPKDFLKIDALPQSATASEVQINFPLSLPLKDGKYRICIDLDKINLPPETFRAVKKSPPKRRRKSNAKNNSKESSTPAEKSDLVKYLEIFSSGCENQHFDGSACGSPMNNNNFTMSTMNFQGQSSEPPINDIVPVQPNQNSGIGNVISLDSSGVIIDESARQLISNQLDKDAGLAGPAPIDTGLNTTNAAVGVNISNAPAGPAATTDGTQMEDFEFPLDIDNSVYRLYEYIENGGEIFNQTNTNQQPSQSENAVRTLSSSSINKINNAPVKVTIQQSNINVKDRKEIFRKRQPPAQVDMMPVPAIKSSTLPELCENRNQAHSQKNTPRHQYSFIREEVLDLSVQKAKGNKFCGSDSVMDLTVSSSYHESLEKVQENVIKSYENVIDLPRNTPQTLNNENIQRISLEEYQKRNANTEKTVPQSLEKNTTEKKKGPKICDKDCVACEDVRVLNNPLVEYEFDEHSSTSGIYSEDCGNKSAGKNSNVSLKGDCTPSYMSREEEEGLGPYHEIDDDTLSIFINSTAGSPFHFSEYNETNAEDGCNSICENRDEVTTTPPCPELTCDTNETPAISDTQIRGVADESSGTKKVFKIPKLVHSTLKPTNAINNSSVLNDLESNLLFPTSQTTSSEFCMKPDNFMTRQALVQSVENNVYNRKDVISDIFGIRPCFMYLEGYCQKPNCKFSHEIIDCNIIRLRLSNLSNTVLNSGYFYISRNKNLFRLYFSAFCDTFSQRGDRKKLVAMIRDCQLYQETIFFLKSIAAAFVKTGMSQVDAVKIIIENCTSSTTEAMDILVDLMVDSDVTQFMSILESYVTNPRYKFKMEAIDKLAFKCNRTKHSDVIHLMFRIITFQLPKQELKDVQSPELVKFLDMVRNSHMTKTVQNVYDSCVNNNNKPNKISDELFPSAVLNSSSRTTLPSMPSLAPLPSSYSSAMLSNFIKRL